MLAHIVAAASWLIVSLLQAVQFCVAYILFACVFVACAACACIHLPPQATTHAACCAHDLANSLVRYACLTSTNAFA
jgi:hypothetical protein